MGFVIYLSTSLSVSNFISLVLSVCLWACVVLACLSVCRYIHQPAWPAICLRSGPFVRPSLHLVVVYSIILYYSSSSFASSFSFISFLWFLLSVHCFLLLLFSFLVLFFHFFLVLSLSPDFVLYFLCFFLYIYLFLLLFHFLVLIFHLFLVLSLPLPFMLLLPLVLIESIFPPPVPFSCSNPLFLFLLVPFLSCRPLPLPPTDFPFLFP